MVTSINVSREMGQQLFQPYDFETTQALGPFLEEYWATAFPTAFIYLLLIIVGQNYMKARKGFNLQWPLVLWSFCLALFSILGTVRTWGYMGTLILSRGLKPTICFSESIDQPTVKFWSCVFVLSKVIELGDTAFIILRKRPLIFMHWYHHSTVLVFTSFGYKNKVPSGGWFMTMNFGVHAIMYTYYTLKAARVKHPRLLPMIITSLQILQMVMGTTVGILNYIWRQEQGCHTTAEHFFWFFVLYFTHFILFSHFFHQTYIKPQVKTKPKSR